MSDAPTRPAGGGQPESARPTWSPWEALPVFGIALVLSAILSTPFVALAPNQHQLTTGQQLAGGIVVELSLGATVLGWLFARHRASMRALGIPRRPLAEIAAGLLAGLLLVGILVYGFGWVLARVLQALSSGRHVAVPRQLPTGIHDGNTLLAAVLVLAAAPICEELFFRGLLFKGLRDRMRFVSAALISAVLFGLAHLQEALPGPWQGAFLLVTVLAFVGFGLAFVYERRGNIVASMAAHGAFNLVGFLVLLHVIG
jgi:membrane protease YdiL (CAAX protease family)